jgi:hypothetical protein
MALADHTHSAETIPEVQRLNLEQNALPARLLFNARGALVDELTYRLIALTAIAWALANLARYQPLLATGVHWAAIVLTALVIYPLGNWNYFRVLDPSA